MKLKDLPRIYESMTIQPSFKLSHVLLSLIIFNQEKEGIGRYRLTKEIGLSEGKVKSLLDRMKKMKLIVKFSRIAGHVITGNGKQLLQELYEKITPPKEPKFNVSELVASEGNYQFFCIVKEGSDYLGSGIEQRDEVIKMGGTGATCLIFKDNRFHFPTIDPTREKPPPFDILPKDLDSSVKNRDVLVIGTAKNKNIARLATLSAAISFLNLF
ncbi:MAG: DUF4443 domain-containing protein [Promethearchaeota archaeon]